MILSGSSRLSGNSCIHNRPAYSPRLPVVVPATLTGSYRLQRLHAARGAVHHTSAAAAASPHSAAAEPVAEPVAAALAHSPEGVAAAAEAAFAGAEAVHEAGQQLQPESEYTEVEEQEVVLVQQPPQDFRTWVTTSGVGRGLLYGAAAFLGGTLAIALYRTYQKANSTRAQRMRTIDKNKALVEALSSYLPSRRAELTPSVATGLRRSSGYSTVEVFRKYLWYLLRERSFDPDAVADMVALKRCLGLTDEEVAEALRERAQRIYDKYGTLMLDTEGLSAAGIERKATCRALVSKLLYLTEHQPLVVEGSAAFATTDLRTIFGATDEDLSKLRIESLVEVDADTLTRLMGAAAAEDASEASRDEPSSSSAAAPDGSSSSSGSSSGGGGGSASGSSSGVSSGSAPKQ